MMQLGTGGMRVAYSVHLGGFAAGVILALVLRGARATRGRSGTSSRRGAISRRRTGSGRRRNTSEYLAIESGDAEAHAELARAFLAAGDRVRSRASYADAVRLSAREEGARRGGSVSSTRRSRHIPNFALPEPLHIDIACGMERTLKYRSAMNAYEHFVWKYPLSKDAPFVLLRMAVILEKRLEKPGEALCLLRAARRRVRVGPVGGVSRGRRSTRLRARRSAHSGGREKMICTF